MERNDGAGKPAATRGLWPKWLARNGTLILLLAGAVAVGAAGAVVVDKTGLVEKIAKRVSGGGEQAAAPEGDIKSIEWKKRETGLATVEIAEIPLGEVDGAVATGGGVDVFGDGVMFASGRGNLGYADLKNGRIAYLAKRVEMNQADLDASEAMRTAVFNPNWFRVNDLMVTKDKDGAPLMVVSHHIYYKENKSICTAIDGINIELVNGIVETRGDWRRIYTVKECIDMELVGFQFEGHKSGARMEDLHNGKMLMTVGEYGLGGRGIGMASYITDHPEHDTTKLLEIDLTTGESKEYARGLRSPNGLHVDERGRIWETEHGPQGGDEINLIKPGKHYGWPYVSFGTGYADEYEPRTALPLSKTPGQHPGYELPFFAFMPSIGIGQILDVPSTSKGFEAWRGDLIVTSVRAKSLYRLRITDDRVIYSEPTELGRCIRDMVWLPDGSLVMVTDDNWLFVMRDPLVHKSGEGDTTLKIAGYDAIRAIEVPEDRNKADWVRNEFREKCANCHSIDGTPGIGPSLVGVKGREIGSSPNFPYSPALTDAKGKWTDEKLVAFISNPKGEIPGTAMPNIPDVGDSFTILSIIDFVNNQTPKPAAGQTDP